MEAPDVQLLSKMSPTMEGGGLVRPDWRGRGGGCSDGLVGPRGLDGLVGPGGSQPGGGKGRGEGASGHGGDGRQSFGQQRDRSRNGRNQRRCRRRWRMGHDWSYFRCRSSWWRWDQVTASMHRRWRAPLSTEKGKKIRGKEITVVERSPAIMERPIGGKRGVGLSVEERGRKGEYGSDRGITGVGSTWWMGTGSAEDEGEALFLVKEGCADGSGM